MFPHPYPSLVMIASLEMANKFLRVISKETFTPRMDGIPMNSIYHHMNIFVQNLTSDILDSWTNPNGAQVTCYLICILMGLPHLYGNVWKYIPEETVQKEVHFRF
jgi:hypothetical protein